MAFSDLDTCNCADVITASCKLVLQKIVPRKSAFKNRAHVSRHCQNYISKAPCPLNRHMQVSASHPGFGFATGSQRSPFFQNQKMHRVTVFLILAENFVESSSARTICSVLVRCYRQYWHMFGRVPHYFPGIPTALKPLQFSDGNIDTNFFFRS
jgi:hypothetical protein